MNLNDPDHAREALISAVESGEAETIARVAMANVWPLLTAHAPLLIASVVRLHTPTLDRYPVLQLVHPMTAVLSRSTRPFRPLISSDDVRSMEPDEVDFVVLTQMIASRMSGDVQAAVRYAERLNDRIEQIRVEARDRADGPLWFFHHQIGSTFFAAGDSARALSEFATARQLGKMSAQPDAERIALGRIALAHATRGALGEAEHALDEARALPSPTTAHLTASRSSEHTAAALIAVDRMDHNLDDALGKLDPHDSTDLTWPLALWARTRAHLARHHPEDALEATRLARDSHAAQTNSLASDVIGASLIEALIQIGDLPGARTVAEEYSPLSMRIMFARVHLSLREGRVDDAAQRLGELATGPTLGPSERAEWDILSGWLEVLRTNDLDDLTAARLARIARKSDNRRLLALMPRQLVDQVRAALPAAATIEFDLAMDGLSHLDVHERPALTIAERRVLHALLKHSSTAAVAAMFHVSRNTVKSQLRSLYRKLDSSTREEALAVASRLRLLGPDHRGG